MPTFLFLEIVAPEPAARNVAGETESFRPGFVVSGAAEGGEVPAGGGEVPAGGPEVPASGCQLDWMSGAGWVVTGTWFEPSAFIVQMSSLAVKLIFGPSGEKAASPWRSSLVVSLVRPEPSVFIV